MVHCDTGNGNRGYELIKFFSRCWSRFELAPEWASYCPVHAHSPCDAHIGKFAQAVDPIKCEGRIIELVEFAEVSTQLPNTHAFVYDDGIDNEDTIFIDENIHQTLVAPRKTSGISLVGHVQCRWQLSNGDYFAEDDVVRVRRHVTKGEWTIWDLDASRPPLCETCSNKYQQPRRHAKHETCELKRQVTKHSVVHATQVIIVLIPLQLRLDRLIKRQQNK